MKDRQPSYANRFIFHPVENMTNTYVLERWDEPTEIGTPLNKATLLSDETAGLFGFDDSAVPSDVFAEIYRKNTYEEIGRSVSGEWKNKISLEINGVSRYREFLIVYSAGTSAGTLPPDYSSSNNAQGVKITISFEGLLEFKFDLDGNSLSDEKTFDSKIIKKEFLGNKVAVFRDTDVYFGENSDVLTISAISNALDTYYFKSDAEIIVYAR